MTLNDKLYKEINMIENRYDLVNKEILDITTKPIEYKELKHEIIFRNKITTIPIRIFNYRKIS